MDTVRHINDGVSCFSQEQAAAARTVYLDVVRAPRDTYWLYHNAAFQIGSQAYVAAF